MSSSAAGPQRVCPDCGEPAGAQPFCMPCGFNLTSRERLPTRTQWERERTSDTVPNPEAITVAPERPTVDAPIEHLPGVGPQRVSAEVHRASERARAARGIPFFRRKAGPEFAGVPMASYGYRVGGYLIGFAFAVLVGFASGAIAGLGGASDDSTAGVWVVATVVAWLINTVVIVGITRGRSIGKLVGGTRIVREDGRPARFGTGFLRDNLCRIIYLVPLASLVDGLSPLGRKRQSLRDKMVGTRVVREPSYDSRARVLALCAVAAIAVTIGAAEFTGT